MDIIKMSSKGQIVIPARMRINLKEGEEFVILMDEDKFILKKAETLSEKMKEDLEFSKRTRKAWKEIDEGEFTDYSVKEYLEKLKK